MSTAGSKIKDEKQEYQYSLPFVTPSGHELTFYDTPENERVILKHASGSRLEFKADGSVHLTVVKDMFIHQSIASTEGTQQKPADASNIRVDTDLNLEVQGRLSIRATSIDIEAGEYIKSYAGTDYTIQGNNVIEKATESIALEGTKSIYVDTKEYRERSVSHLQEEGTKEDGAQGGLNVVNVYGNAIIRNDDPNGGITIASKGYLNLVCGQERVDVVGQYTTTPSSLGVGTFTQQVFVPKTGGALNKSYLGDYVGIFEGGGFYNYNSTNKGSTPNPSAGLTQFITGAMLQTTTENRLRTVGGDEIISISGIQIVKAEKIFLN